MLREIACLGLLLGGCAHRAPSGTLVLRVRPPEARVLLDDRYIGSAAKLSGRPLKLNAGKRRVEISAEGRYAARREADIPPNGHVELEVDLHEVPDGLRGD